jgi:dUTP pyrophosphatase
MFLTGSLAKKFSDIFAGRPHLIWESLGLELKVAQFDRDRFFQPPVRGSEHAAGFDFYAPDRIKIKPGGSSEVHTNIIMEIPQGWFGLFLPRSSIGCQYHVRFANTAPVIDSDYRGEVVLKLITPNNSEGEMSIGPGERFCQMLLLPAPGAKVKVVTRDELSETGRGSGGFGSTGKH